MAGISQRWFVRLPAGLLALDTVLALAAFLAVALSWYAGIAATVILALALVVGSVAWRAWSLSWAALIALPAGVICGMELSDYSSLARGEIASVASPGDVAGRAQATGFVFERARVRSELQGSYRHSSRSRSGQPATVTWFYAAPLVPDGWTSADPVPAWAVCRDERCRADWELPLRAAIRPPQRYAEEHRTVVAEAQTSHGLISAPDAPALVWVASPAGAIAEQLASFWLAVKIWNGVFLAGWAGFAVWRALRRSPPGSGADATAGA
jgi:hypothetical protein